ncbi:MAG: hypothetical protein ABI905_08430 [Betaproteobacteria bacterium]
MNIIRDPIDDMLKGDAAQHRDSYVDDDGFTLRVVDALGPRASISTAMRFFILGGITLVATLCVAFLSGGGNFLVDAAMDIATSTMTQAAVSFFALVATLIAVSIATAHDR